MLASENVLAIGLDQDVGHGKQAVLVRFEFESFVLLLVRLLQILVLLLRKGSLSHGSEVSLAFSVLFVFLVELLHWDGAASIIVEILILTLIERLEVRLEDFEDVEDVGLLFHGPVEIV